VDLKNKIVDFSKQCIEKDDTFVVDVEIKGNPNNQKIQVFIDGDQSVDVDECSRISRKLSGMLEDLDLIDGRYILEVSSPGVSRPLRFSRQFPKHIGRDFDIVTKDKDKYRGELIDVVDENIVLSIPEGPKKKGSTSKELKIQISDIDTAKVIVRF
jgi:ribosome maturation factor RimP